MAADDKAFAAARSLHRHLESHLWFHRVSITGTPDETYLTVWVRKEADRELAPKEWEGLQVSAVASGNNSPFGSVHQRRCLVVAGKRCLRHREPSRTIREVNLMPWTSTPPKGERRG